MTATGKAAKALLGIKTYTEKVVPTTLAQAVHMLSVIKTIAAETLGELAPEPQTADA